MAFVGVAVPTITLLVLAWYVIDVLLLVFAALLIAILFHAPASWLAHRLNIPAGAALALVLATLTITLGAGGWLFGRSVAAQMGELVNQLPVLFNSLWARMSEYQWLTDNFRPRMLLGGESQFVGKGLSAISTTFGMFANVVIVLLMAVFFAAQPQLYVDGFLRLIPIPRRARMREVLIATGQVLRRWLLGQLILMSFVAVATGIGLSLLGVQFAVALAVIAGLFSFVPYAGPILGAVPAVLVGLAESPLVAGYVALLYIGVQVVQAPLEPIVQQRAAQIAPVMILFSQVVLGVLVGALGVMFATPLSAAAVVWVRMLYVEDVLGDTDGG